MSLRVRAIDRDGLVCDYCGEAEGLELAIERTPSGDGIVIRCYDGAYCERQQKAAMAARAVLRALPRSAPRRGSSGATWREYHR